MQWNIKALVLPSSTEYSTLRKVIHSYDMQLLRVQEEIRFQQIAKKILDQHIDMLLLKAHKMQMEEVLEEIVFNSWMEERIRYSTIGSACGC